MSLVRNNNSKIIAEYILAKLGNKWQKISKAKPGKDRLDSVLIYLFFVKQMVAPTSSRYNTLGTIDGKSKILIDFIQKQANPNIKGIEYSKKGYAIFAYETVLDFLYNSTHTYDWETTKVVRAANRNNFKTFDKVEDFDEFELEFDEA